MSDWSSFDQIIGQGNGPYRSLFEKIVNQTNPMPTGVPFLDSNLEGGLHPGVLNVIAGRTSHGKTLLTRTILHANAPKRILYLFADEDRGLVAMDLAASIMGRRGYEVKRELQAPNGLLTPMELERQIVAKFPQLYIPDDDMLGASIDDVASVVDQAERYWGAPPELIVFDYLGCLSLEDGDTSTMGLVHTRQHKKLCRMFPDSVWLLTSQLSRGGNMKEAPSLDQMFGGGEAAIDGCAIGVWRFHDRTHNDNYIMLNIMKSKQGRAYPGGPVKVDKAGDNPLSNDHVHTITSGSLVHPKPWPTVEVRNGR